MATYYVDLGGSTGAENGSQSDPWNGAAGMQTAADTATEGDTVYIKGSATLAAAIDFDTNSGDNGSGAAAIKYIGVDSSWNTGHGTSYLATLDGNSTATNCINCTQTNLYFENIEVKLATGDNWYDTGGYTLLRYCRSEEAGGDGFDFDSGANYCSFEHCIAYNNNAHGFRPEIDNTLSFCVSHLNSSRGFSGTQYSLVGCLAYKNGSDGFYVGYSGGCWNCIADRNDGDAGFRIGAYGSVHLVGCRATNQTGDSGDGKGFKVAYDYNAPTSFIDYCVAFGNAAANGDMVGDAQVTKGDNNLTGDDGDVSVDGFVDSVNADYNLADGAAISGEAADSEIPLNWDDASDVDFWIAAGLPPEGGAGGGGAVQLVGGALVGGQ